MAARHPLLGRWMAAPTGPTPEEQLTRGLDFLLRDCTNMCSWFRARGLEVDEQDLFGELMAHAF